MPEDYDVPLPFEPPLEDTSTEAEVADAPEVEEPTLTMPSTDALDAAYQDGFEAGKKQGVIPDHCMLSTCQKKFLNIGMTSVIFHRGKLYCRTFCATVDN